MHDYCTYSGGFFVAPMAKRLFRFGQREQLRACCGVEEWDCLCHTWEKNERAEKIWMIVNDHQGKGLFS